VHPVLWNSRPDELALAGPEHLDPAHVAGYDRKAGIDPSDDLALLRERGLGPESTLVDLGSGTGTFALAAAPQCGRVLAVDVSQAMVDATRRKAAELGIENVECVRAGFLSYEHTGAPADFVYTRNALHHLADFWKAIALDRMAHFLRPGGVLLLRDLVFAFKLGEADRFISAWLETGPESPEEGWTRAELEVHLRDEYSTFTWLLEPMLEQAGFEIEQASYGALRVHAEYVCTRRSR
jgi:ubiquinone/menaquinone biosynthesis C-methylase UbiE